jgi:hypothetical protein
MAILNLRTLSGSPDDVVKTTPLTHAEMDANFINLDTEISELKAEIDLTGPNALPGFAKRGQVFDRQGKVSNANFPVNAWDHSIYGPRVLGPIAGVYYMYYTAYKENYAENWSIAVATSTDLVSWTKPVLNRHSVLGSTANNILLAVTSVNMQFADIMFDSESNKYLMTVRNDSSGSNLVYECATPTGVFTWVTGASFSGTTGLANGGVAAHPTGHVEAKALTYSATHNKYRIWYNHGHFTPSSADSRRSIGYYDSTSLAGPWTNRGLMPEFTSTDTTLQYYDFSPYYHDGKLFAAVNIFNKTTEVLSPMRCYSSDDGGDTWVRYMDLIQRSSPGSWDYGLVTDGAPILKDGVWYLYYGGKTGLHNETQQIFLGLATTRIG